ncbi:hypothetical protein FHG87_005641 [Trinorchestia longiramus]|nr:hypothetical protein FHG87_005641 [Trinorchestia longiramus]
MKEVAGLTLDLQRRAKEFISNGETEGEGREGEGGGGGEGGREGGGGGGGEGGREGGGGRGGVGRRTLHLLHRSSTGASV